MIRFLSAAALTATLGYATTSLQAAETGVTDKAITFGQAAALDGPAKALGIGMKAGLEAAFDEVNAAGGVNGRELKLISRDDGYNPQKSIEQTKALISEDEVFAIIGPVGTPTAKATVPVVGEAGLPYIGPFTGAGFLRDAEKLPYVYNFRATYGQEMEAQTAYLVDKMKFTKVACFYQNDGFGQAGLSGIKAALEKRGMELVATGTYERNTTAVRKGLLEIRKAKPEAVVMVGAYAPCAEFVKNAKKAGMKDVIFTNVSFVGTKALIEALGDDGEGVIISQVVPLPKDDSVPAVKAYHAAMKAAGMEDQVGFVSLEGYLVGKLAAEALAKVEGEPTREAMLNSFKALSADFGGVSVAYGEGDNQGSEVVWLSAISGGDVKLVE